MLVSLICSVCWLSLLLPCAKENLEAGVASAGSRVRGSRVLLYQHGPRQASASAGGGLCGSKDPVVVRLAQMVTLANMYCATTGIE